MINPPSTESLWKKLANVLSYYALLFVLILALLTGYSPTFFLIQLVAIPLLWLCMRPTFPLRPKLPKQDFSIVESWVWFGGAAVCALTAIGGAYGLGIRDALKLFQAISIGVAAWAIVFLACRDCRRTIHSCLTMRCSERRE